MIGEWASVADAEAWQRDYLLHGSGAWRTGEDGKRYHVPLDQWRAEITPPGEG